MKALKRVAMAVVTMTTPWLMPPNLANLKANVYRKMCAELAYHDPPIATKFCVFQFPSSSMIFDFSGFMYLPIVYLFLTASPTLIAEKKKNGTGPRKAVPTNPMSEKFLE